MFIRVARILFSAVAVPGPDDSSTNDSQYGVVTTCRNAVELREVNKAVPTIITCPTRGTEPPPMPMKATVGIPIKLTTELANETRRNHVNLRANSPLYSTCSDEEEEDCCDEDDVGCSIVAKDLLEKRHRLGESSAIRLVRLNMPDVF